MDIFFILIVVFALIAISILRVIMLNSKQQVKQNNKIISFLEEIREKK